MVVLAAGKSTRMGENKLLLPIGCEPMIRRVVKSALASRVDEVVVVLGHEADKVRSALEDLPCKFVVNEKYEEGQSSSVKAGLRAVKEDASAVLVLPGDVALTRPEYIDRVIEGHARSNAAIVVASYKGRGGHPILLDRRLFEEIMEIGEEAFGLKAVVNRHGREALKVDMGSADVLLDVDTKEDLNRALGKLRCSA